MIVAPSGIYNGEFIKKKFAYGFFAEDNKLFTLGNIISFLGGVDMKVPSGDPIISKLAVNFCIELPNTNIFTGICVQRLFNSMLGNILAASYINHPVEIDGGTLIIKHEFESNGILIPEGKLSFSSANQVGDTCLLYTGINIDAGPNAPGATYSVNISESDCNTLMQEMNSNFYSMMLDIFNTSRQ